MHLTRALIEARFPQPILNCSQKMGELSDAEIEASLEKTLENRCGEDLWLFAYGSLMWRPDFAYADRAVARVQGYHRSFCLWQRRYRGNRFNPNLMLALDAGGSCAGVAFRVAAPGRQAECDSVAHATIMQSALYHDSVGSIQFENDSHDHRYNSATTSSGASLMSNCADNPPVHVTTVHPPHSRTVHYWSPREARDCCEKV